MTHIESIYEIEAKLHDLQSYLHAKNVWVAKTAQNKYEQLVDRFFSEHGCLVKPEKRSNCLHDYDYFLSLMESTREFYYSGHENSP